MNLLALAAHESTEPSSDAASATQHFSRHLYVDGLTYLLRALPEDLSEGERLSIRTALPVGIASPQVAFIGPDQTLPAPPQEVPLIEENSRDVSVIHRIFAFITIQFFIVVHFLLPYIKLFIGQVYRYERENRVSERVLRSSLDTIDNVGQRSIQVADAVCKLNDGKVGQAMHEFGCWWIQGMVGGLHEGIGEGLAIVGATQDSPRTVYRRTP